MNKNIFVIVISLMAILSLSSCKNEAKEEIEARNAYLEANNITTSPTASGLYYIETKEGTGVQAESGDTVSVDYIGKFLNGTTFDSSYDRGEPLVFVLGRGRVIPGWDEGIAYMKNGGEATLIIPSDLAYGTDDYYSIPGYSTLIFEVALVDVKKTNK